MWLTLKLEKQDLALLQTFCTGTNQSNFSYEILYDTCNQLTPSVHASPGTVPELLTVLSSLLSELFTAHNVMLEK